MTTLNKLTALNAPQRILLYGEPKCGKSVAAALLAKKYKVIFFDMENALLALLSNVPKENQDNIEYIPLKDSQDNPVAITLLPDIIAGKQVNFCTAHSKKMCMECRKNPEATYETVNLSGVGTETVVVLDSFTQLTDSVLGLVSKDLDIDEKLQFDHWGEMARRLGRLLSAIQVCSFHLVATSHEQIVTLPSKKEKLIPTLGSRNTSKQVGRYFDHLVRLEVRNRDFMQYSAQGTQINAQVGSRSNIDLTQPGTSLFDLLEGKSAPTNVANSPTINKESSDDVLGKKPRILSQTSK